MLRSKWQAAILMLASAWAFASEPVPNFNLLDVSLSSARRGTSVSPRDYLTQVSGFYFADATCSYCRAQFGHLQQLQAELRNENLLFNVEILGVNSLQANSELAIQLTTAANTLSWLQETIQQPVWSRWTVTYRDVRILDSSNRLAGVFNLTRHDLSKPADFAALKSMFIAAANQGDDDSDRLPDRWEMMHAGLFAPDDDTDGDLHSNFVELAFGTDPRDPSSFPLLQSGFATGSLTVGFTRWAGSPFRFVVESSTNLTSWSSFRITAVTTNLYDGTGRSYSTYRLPRPASPLPSTFVRVRLLDPP